MESIRRQVMPEFRARYRKVDVLLTRETGVPAYVAEASMDCTALGASRALAEYQILRRSMRS